jgi:pimeloyl-ACP methyl ester carboxylesterase
LLTYPQFINGLAVTKMSYQRQTLYFGHEHGDRYSVLIMDNRGIGGSSQPFTRYSTSELAKDVLAVVDHVGWTSPRSIHATGISMGGMIAQELAMLIPERLATLSLLCTAAVIDNSHDGLLDGLAKRMALFVPRNQDNSVRHTAQAIFPQSWLEAEDKTVLPTKTTPRVKFYEGQTEYGRFGNNYERHAAQEVIRKTQENFSIKGLLLQGVAAGWHRKSPEQLKYLRESIGSERMLVMHGTDDNLFSTPHGRHLIAELKPAVGLIVEGMGHAPPIERTEWYNNVAQKHFESGEKLSGR